MSSPTINLNTPTDLLDSPNSGSFQEPEAVSYNHIPFLAELLPQYRGMPGFVYAQVCTQTLVRAQSEGWQHLGDRKVYTIVGPQGQADMILLTRGQPIPGQSPDAGARLCGVDNLVQELTGLTIPRLGGNLEEAPNVKADGRNSHPSGSGGGGGSNPNPGPLKEGSNRKSPGRPKN